MQNDKILVIHCGGTLGMVKTNSGYTVEPHNLYKMLTGCNQLNQKNTKASDFDTTEHKKIATFDKSSTKDHENTYQTDKLGNQIVNIYDKYIFYDQDFVTSHNERSITYNLVEMRHIIDSSLASLNDWFCVLEVVKTFYRSYYGFVIVHGTDTLSYAASFFYYMTRNIKIICTGAIEPMIVNKDEGTTNIINSLANIFTVKEVSVCFGSYIMPGNNSHKIETDNRNSFWSNRMKNLENNQLVSKNFGFAKNGMPCNFRENVSNLAPTLRHTDANTKIYASYNKRIGIVKIYPGILPMIIKSYLESYDAIIIETFGCGNGLTNNNYILELISEYINNDKIIINVSQCLNGGINELYEVNSKLAKLGVISGGFMKTEAIFCLLAWALGNFDFCIAKNHIIEEIKKFTA